MKILKLETLNLASLEGHNVIDFEGGVLRDIFINEEPLVFRKEVYATVCIFGGVVYWLIGLVLPSNIVQQLACAALVVTVRFLAVKHNWSFPQMHN